ncbi:MULTISPECIES: efflux RND transporter periplasmic adaptor subunit [Bosea]|uniref:efflux RND transporter periplasmic adaptor subunit n=1 Tax=Bosea TaxID=85413 RepID=UPI00214F633D|nr:MULTISPECIES: efflux RND transporter periplasmic adaptor subunit [Bosea]MCR4521466.1 efflux RND transporter periplasmic adaptor subunit [Bosea sp. 47.2.35]MDR6829211.1 multidrug efflux system membrane fusion protein [Bosea robiniae]MDR6896274.1 multidrug efflux system membrane fusion protein [Bosea sp. BE109]MDR7139492.1 multidrug efflux system membrane fusion protein [Bosea sp. BE168]MDR7176369.1 multidrug efflux system membrane fusion protein [Bosea sp. BE271]
MIPGTNRRGLLAGLTASVALTAITVFALSGTRAQGDTAPAAPPAVPVSVATVEAREVVPWAEFSGRLEAIERVELRSRVAGVVEAVHFREGNLVKQGELLVSIDQAPYLADLQRAEAQVQGAKARVALAESENERGQQLLATRNLSQRDVDTRVNNLREAQANLQAAEAARRTAQLNLDYTQIRAPISGRIGRLDVTIGNLIAAGGQVLTSLLSVDPIYAAFNADERSVLDALASLPDGSRALEQIPVRLTTATAQAAQFTGKLHFVDNGIDGASGTVRVRAQLDNPDGKLMPGQFVRVQLGQARAEQQLVINERAVGTDQNKKFVFVVGDDAKAAWREVSLGAAHDGLRVVIAGLKPGERIVVNGLQRVRPGATVAPEPVPMAEKSELKKPATELAQR